MLPPPESLSWLDLQWSRLFSGGNQWLVLTVVSFVVHEIAYFGRYLPFYIAEKIPALQKYKLQPGKDFTSEQRWKCLKYVLLYHYTVELPLMIGFHPTANSIGMKIQDVPLPSWTVICWQTFLFMVFEDFFHYWAHRLLHHPPLYKIVHKMHHEYAAPIGLAAEYAHPLEILILSMGTFLGPLIYCFASNGDLHVFTMIVWSVVRTAQAVDAHSGYDFPWSLHNFIPLWSGAEHHDYHHQCFVGNYATSFRWCDYVFGTDTAYHTYRKKQKMQKLSSQKNAKAE